MIATGARHLDSIRSRCLELTLRWGFLRDVFKHRSKRLLLQFFTSLSWQLPLAIFFPVPMLILGPAILGVPHLFSSLRHGVAHPRHLFRSQRLLVTLILMVWVSVGFARYFDGFDHPLLFESAGMVLTFFLVLPFFRMPLAKWAPGAFVLTALAVATYLKPLHMTGFLVLFHNFVGFFHWWKGTRSSRDRRTVLLCGVGFVIAHGMIFSGAFDPWIGNVPFSDFDLAAFAPIFGAWSSEFAWAARAVVAYAFGQSMHYFVWMKCIPDQHHTSEVSTSFRQSYRLLEQDFGGRGVLLVAFLSAGTIGLALTLSMEQFRMIYFSMAAFHGFLELAGLFILAEAEA